MSGGSYAQSMTAQDVDRAQKTKQLLDLKAAKTSPGKEDIFTKLRAGASGASQQQQAQVERERSLGGSSGPPGSIVAASDAAERDMMARRSAQSLSDFDQYLAKMQAGREADLAAGRSRGASLFGEGSLGRLDAKRAAEVEGLIAERRAMQALGNRSGDIADVVARRRANLVGFTPEEQAAFREQNVQALQQSQGGQLRQLRAQQALSGVRGPAALAQQQALQAKGQEALTNTERDLFLQNMAQRRAALGEFEGSVTGAESREFERKMGTQSALEQAIGKAREEELAKQQFNLAQAGKERYGALATELGYGSLGAAERGAAMQRMLGEQQLTATNQFANQGKK